MDWGYSTALHPGGDFKGALAANHRVRLPHKWCQWPDSGNLSAPGLGPALSIKARGAVGMVDDMLVHLSSWLIKLIKLIHYQLLAR